MTDIIADHEWSEQPICPHCGKVDSDGWEIFEPEDETAETECLHCGQIYRCTRHELVRYVTSKP